MRCRKRGFGQYLPLTVSFLRYCIPIILVPDGFFHGIVIPLVKAPRRERHARMCIIARMPVAETIHSLMNPGPNPKSRESSPSASQG